MCEAEAALVADARAEVAEAATELATDAALSIEEKFTCQAYVSQEKAEERWLTYLDLALLATLVAEATTLASDWSTDSAIPLALDL